MANETVAPEASDPMTGIFRELVAIESLAQILQKAFSGNEQATAGIYGTALLIEQMSQRAQDLTEL